MASSSSSSQRSKPEQQRPQQQRGVLLDAGASQEAAQQQQNLQNSTPDTPDSALHQQQPSQFSEHPDGQPNNNKNTGSSSGDNSSSSDNSSIFPSWLRLRPVSITVVVATLLALVLGLVNVASLVQLFDCASASTDAAIERLAGETIFQMANEIERPINRSTHAVSALANATLKFGNPFDSPTGSTDRQQRVDLWINLLLRHTLTNDSPVWNGVVRFAKDSATLANFNAPGLIKVQVCQSAYREFPADAFLDKLENCTTAVQDDATLTAHDSSSVAREPWPNGRRSAYLGEPWNDTMSRSIAVRTRGFWLANGFYFYNTVRNTDAGALRISGYSFHFTFMAMDFSVNPAQPIAMIAGRLVLTGFGPKLRQHLPNGTNSRAFLLDGTNQVISYSHGPSFKELSVTNDTDGVNFPRGCQRWEEAVGCFYNISDHEPYELLRLVGADAEDKDMDSHSVYFRPFRRRPDTHSALVTLERTGEVYQAFHSKLRNDLYNFTFTLYVFIPRDYFVEGVDRAVAISVAVVIVLALAGCAIGAGFVTLATRSVAQLAERMDQDPWTAALTSLAARRRAAANLRNNDVDDADGMMMMMSSSRTNSSAGSKATNDNMMNDANAASRSPAAEMRRQQQQAEDGGIVVDLNNNNNDSFGSSSSAGNNNHNNGSSSNLGDRVPNLAGEDDGDCSEQQQHHHNSNFICVLCDRLGAFLGDLFAPEEVVILEDAFHEFRGKIENLRGFMVLPPGQRHLRSGSSGSSSSSSTFAKVEQKQQQQQQQQQQTTATAGTRNNNNHVSFGVNNQGDEELNNKYNNMNSNNTTKDIPSSGGSDSDTKRKRQQQQQRRKRAVRFADSTSGTSDDESQQQAAANNNGNSNNDDDNAAGNSPPSTTTSTSSEIAVAAAAGAAAANDPKVGESKTHRRGRVVQNRTPAQQHRLALMNNSSSSNSITGGSASPLVSPSLAPHDGKSLPSSMLASGAPKQRAYPTMCFVAVVHVFHFQGFNAPFNTSPGGTSPPMAPVGTATTAAMSTPRSPTTSYAGTPRGKMNKSNTMQGLIATQQHQQQQLFDSNTNSNFADLVSFSQFAAEQLHLVALSTGATLAEFHGDHFLFCVQIRNPLASKIATRFAQKLISVSHNLRLKLLQLCRLRMMREQVAMQRAAAQAAANNNVTAVSPHHQQSQQQQNISLRSPSSMGMPSEMMTSECIRRIDAQFHGTHLSAGFAVGEAWLLNFEPCGGQYEHQQQQQQCLPSPTKRHRRGSSSGEQQQQQQRDNADATADDNDSTMITARPHMFIGECFAVALDIERRIMRDTERLSRILVVDTIVVEQQQPPPPPPTAAAAAQNPEQQSQQTQQQQQQLPSAQAAEVNNSSPVVAPRAFPSPSAAAAAATDDVTSLVDEPPLEGDDASDSGRSNSNAISGAVAALQHAQQQKELQQQQQQQQQHSAEEAPPPPLSSSSPAAPVPTTTIVRTKRVALPFAIGFCDEQRDMFESVKCMGVGWLPPRPPVDVQSAGKGGRTSSSTSSATSALNNDQDTDNNNNAHNNEEGENAAHRVSGGAADDDESPAAEALQVASSPWFSVNGGRGAGRLVSRLLETNRVAKKAPSNYSSGAASSRSLSMPLPEAAGAGQNE